jgi:polar amino acid transport system ATP-binding protein
MGPSGSGKTTILRVIAGLDTFERGTLSVDGVGLSGGPHAAAALRQLRRKVGMVFQFHCLFEHLSALHNVWLAPVHTQRAPRRDAERRGIELLRTLGIEHRAQA